LSHLQHHISPPIAANIGASLWRGCRIGLLGGSFNPAHDGHLEITMTAIKRLRLHAVWWLVSPQNPLKSNANMAPLADRLDSARAIATDRRIAVTAIEQNLGSQYTVDTLKVLRRRASTTRFVWLMGADNLVQLPRWRDWAGIVDAAPMAIFARHPYDLSALTGKAAQRFRSARVPSSMASRLIEMPAPAWMFFALRHNPQSATAIRHSRAEHR